MIASWRARSGSPSQRVVGSPNRGGDTPRLFGRDPGWNVSIRRRKRNERNEIGLAEQAEELVSHLIPEASQDATGNEDIPRALNLEPPIEIAPRAPSSLSAQTDEPARVLTGEVGQQALGHR